MAEKLRVSVDHPHLAKGEVVDVGGLAAVENGSSAEISAEDAELFKERTGMTPRQFFSKDSTVKVESAGGGDKD